MDKTREDIKFVSPRDKNRKNKRIQRIKLLCCLILSNLFLFLLLRGNMPSRIAIPQKPMKIFAKHFLVSVPLKIFLPLIKEDKTEATLYNGKKKLIIKKIFIHSYNKSTQTAVIEIHQNQISILIKNKDLSLQAFPSHEKFPNNLRRKYEVYF
jgi:hypothetical protein